MINVEAIIQHFGAEAVRLQLHEAQTLDDSAIDALRNANAADRIETLLGWFYNYRVFQGLSTSQRFAVVSAVLKWADASDRGRDLGTIDALAEAHGELMAVCSDADGRSRDFTSLASKALWLCYPEDVPIFDSFAQRALWVIAKLENVSTQGATGGSEYRKFVHIWKDLYKRYAMALNNIDACGYPYRVRIFDKVLWMIGTRDYEYQIADESK